MSNHKQNLGRIIKQQRVMSGLTLREVSDKSGVSLSHLGCIGRGKCFPSGHILRRIAEPLGFEETELFYQAGFLSPKPPVAEGEHNLGRLDPYVARVLSQEPFDMQRAVIGILIVLKSIAKEIECNVGFAEYTHRNYPEVDENIITMSEDLLGHLIKT